MISNSIGATGVIHRFTRKAARLNCGNQLQMMSNSNAVLRMYQRTDMVMVYIILVISVGLSIILASLILIMIYATKTLHSPANLLVVNTSKVTILLMIICMVNASYFFMESPLTDQQCRIQAYLTYALLNSIAYFSVIQSISRLCFTVFPRHRYMLNYKSHFILILIGTCGSLLVPLPSLVTNDTIYRRLSICLIPMKYSIHVAYFSLSSYFIPLIIVEIIYVIIHHRVRLSSRLLQNA